jgi:hypothetical protein
MQAMGQGTCVAAPKVTREILIFVKAAKVMIYLNKVAVN